jgi:DNA-binding transcriptional ArsR family regulator
MLDPENVYKLLEPAIRGAEQYRPQRKDAGHIGNSPKNADSSRHSTAMLENMQFDPLQWLVPGILPEGLSILAAPPKAGKSYLALGVAVAVSAGGDAFVSILCEQCDVLYLALEDSFRRLQARMRQLLPFGGWPERLIVQVEATRVGEGLEDEIAAWAEGSERPRLVIIDTWRTVKPESRGRGSAYDEDATAIAPLHALANRFPGMGILLIHHTRKMESDDAFATISGTYGLTGVADSMLVLARHGDGHKLCVRGREIEDAEKALERDRLTGGWIMKGDARELAKTGERQKIIGVLTEAGDEILRTSQIATAIGKKADATSYLLKKLRDEGLVESPAFGKWKLSNTPSNSTNPSKCEDGPKGITPDIEDFEGFEDSHWASEDEWGRNPAPTGFKGSPARREPA